MTDINLDELIAEAKKRSAASQDAFPEASIWDTVIADKVLITRLIAALEQVQGSADEWLSGRIVTASFETGEPWPCGLEDCECPEHDSPAPPKGTYVTVRLDGEKMPVGLWPVKITRVSEARVGGGSR